MYGSATDLIHSFKSGVSSPSAIVKECFGRIEQYNPTINALVTFNKSHAIDQAQQVDKILELYFKSGQKELLPALLGLPISVKDVFETQSIKTTSSYPPLRDHIPTQDASVVARVKSAGAIILGKTNTPELASDVQTWSPIFGRTNNPWDVSLTSGGSSGGSAAAIATGFSFLDIGSDLAGSIRIPAAYCGVAGLKATENRIPRTGHIPHLPNTPRSVRHLLSFGVLARYVKDLRLGLDVLSGPDGLDSEIPPVSAFNFEGVKQSLRIAYWADFSGIPICQRTKIAFEHTVDQLKKAGIHVERCYPNGFDFEAAWYAYGIIMGTEVGLSMPNLERFFLSLAGKVIPKNQPLLRAVAKGMSLDLRAYNDALNIRERLISQLEAFLNTWDVWLCPTTPSVAFPHHKPKKFGRPPAIMMDDVPMSYLEGTISMTAPFSLTGNPVVSMPVGVVDGLPIGVQLIGKRWQDERLLDHCQIIENIIGGFQPPPNYA